jgi:hypothetical protein
VKWIKLSNNKPTKLQNSNYPKRKKYSFNQMPEIDLNAYRSVPKAVLVLNSSDFSDFKITLLVRNYPAVPLAIADSFCFPPPPSHACTMKITGTSDHTNIFVACLQNTQGRQGVTGKTPFQQPCCECVYVRAGPTTFLLCTVPGRFHSVAAISHIFSAHLSPRVSGCRTGSSCFSADYYAFIFCNLVLKI